MSPIKGVSDLVRLPRLGKIKLGEKVDDPKARSPYPRALDHFNCPEEVKKVFGEKPRELKIMFPTEDDSQWAQQWLRCYSASRGLVCRGDGETAIARVDKATGEIAAREAKDTELREVPCNPGSCSYFQRKQCRMVMNLQFLLPDVPGFGVWQINTSSFHSIRNINSGIKFIRGIAGRISMIPLLLKLEPLEVQPEGLKKNVHVLTLTAPYSLVEVQRYAQMPPGQALLLPPPDTEAPEDLYPQEVLEQGQEEPVEDIPVIDEELLKAWENVKASLRALAVTDGQVAKWFRQYGMDVRLSDFDQPFPPQGFSSAMLSRFCDSLLRYEQRRKKPREEAL